MAKYIVGFITLFGPQDVYQSSVFILRLPFALMGALCSLLIYKILQNEFKNTWLSSLGALWYILLPFSYVATRMVMLEAPMHLFWLLFHYFFIKGLNDSTKKHFLLAGIFIGLALGTKVPSLTLYLFSALIFFLYKRKNIKNFLSMYVASFTVFGLTYTHFVLVEHLSGLKSLYTTFKDVILARNQEGKLHLVGDKVFLISPWWLYLYFVNIKYHAIQLFGSLLAFFAAFTQKNKFISYWAIFVLVQIIFFQSVPLKAERYISSIELGLPFLLGGAIKGLYDKISIRKSQNIFIGVIVVLMVSLTSSVTYARVHQQPTGYNAMRKFIVTQTNNFTEFKKVYVYGSVRSSRWYKQNSMPDMFTFDKNFQNICKTFNEFDYLFFDKEELMLSGEPIEIYTVIVGQGDRYIKTEIDGFEVFEKLPDAEVVLTCL